MKNSVLVALGIALLGWTGAPAPTLASDSLQTVDGRTLVGEVTLGTAGIQVHTGDGKTVDLKLDDVADLRIEPREHSTTQTSVADVPVRHGLRAEYFSDPYFKKPRCVRLESRLDYQAGADLPTFACDNDYSIRWSGRFVTEVGGSFSLKATGEGVRSVVLKVRKSDGTTLQSEGPESLSGPIEFKPNEPVDLTVEAAGVTPYSSISLLWGRGASAEQIIPSSLLLPPVQFTDEAWHEWLKADQGAGLVAQYFDGEQFNTPALTALEPTAMGGERGPRRTSSTPYGIRWTGRLELPADGKYEISAQPRTEQPLRVWIDSKLVIETYDELDRKTSFNLSGKAGQKLDLRIETSRKQGRGGEENSLLIWSGPTWKDVPIGRDCFYPPVSVPRPWLVFLPSIPSQEDATRVEVVLAGQPADGPATVEVTDAEGRLLATSKQAPYQFVIPRMTRDLDPNSKSERPKSELIEVREIMARVTDSKGVVGVSNTQTISKRPSVPSSLGNGWFASTVGRVWRNRPVPSRLSPEKVEFPGLGGEIFRTTDGYLFFHKALEGQGRIEARLSLTGSSEEKAPVTGGIMIRDEIDPRSRYLGLFLSRGQLVVVRRDRPSALPSLAVVPGMQPPCWVRLTRQNGRLTASTSPDGVAWTDLAIDPMPVIGTVYPGICNLGNSAEVATFDSLRILNTGSEDPAFPQGIQAVTGSVLGGRISDINDKNITLTRPGIDTMRIARSDIARIFLRAVPPAALENVRDRRGVLLPKGDVYEGGISSFSTDSVDVDSLIFGPRTFTSAEAAGILLNQVGSPSASIRFEVQLGDGSKLLVDDLKLESNDVLVRESRLGSMKLPLAEIRGIRRSASKAP